MGKFVQRHDDQTGFTLIELMIVVAIVAVLASVSIPAYFNHTKRSRQSEAIGELMAIKGAQERYFAENGGYAGRINLLDKYSGAGTTFTSGYYQYSITANTTLLVTSGAVSAMARGDLNGDGVFNDRWQLSIDNIEAKPQHDDTGANEGFSWSSLGAIFK